MYKNKENIQWMTFKKSKHLNMSVYQTTTDALNRRSLPPPPPNPIGPPRGQAQDPFLLTNQEPPTTSNFQNRGLCGLREPLLNYDISRLRRRSGEQFRNDWIEPPFKRKFHQQTGHFR